MAENLTLILTEDGSHSLFRKDLNETYHSLRGAMAESSYVFIEKGLHFVCEHQTKSPKIFEVGLGTGLNAWLAARYALDHIITVDYHAVEPFPVPPTLYKQLNYGEDRRPDELLLAIHETSWGVKHPLHPHFFFTKQALPLEQFESTESFDLIFFDAFAPSRQASVWQRENLEKCFSILKSPGSMVTYCAQGQFKRDLAASGFQVEVLPGALGKKEMVRGIKR